MVRCKLPYTLHFLFQTLSIWSSSPSPSTSGALFQPPPTIVAFWIFFEWYWEGKLTPLHKRQHTRTPVGKASKTTYGEYSVGKSFLLIYPYLLKIKICVKQFTQVMHNQTQKTGENMLGKNIFRWNKWSLSVILLVRKLEIAIRFFFFRVTESAGMDN